MLSLDGIECDAVWLTWELVYFWKNSTWKVSFIPESDFTKNLKFETSVHLMILHNLRNTKVHYLIVVLGNGWDIAIYKYAKTVNHSGIKRRFWSILIQQCGQRRNGWPAGAGHCFRGRKVCSACNIIHTLPIISSLLCHLSKGNLLYNATIPVYYYNNHLFTI